jgi:hypothetical protein
LKTSGISMPLQLACKDTTVFFNTCVIQLL